jgi:hypothetical protein
MFSFEGHPYFNSILTFLVADVRKIVGPFVF